MCESGFKTAGERHGMCESALTMFHSGHVEGSLWSGTDAFVANSRSSDCR
jgi:hypothetical protein